MSNEIENKRHLPPQVRRIVLTGFMGSGKSTVGPLLAARLRWRFVDADDVIEAETGVPISVYFARFGEADFRERECHTVARLAAEDRLVLALGGGAIETAATRDVLLRSPGTILVHLEVALETTIKRCGGTEGTRPVLADRANLEARYARRLPLYRLAHVSIAADVLTPNQLVEAIVVAANSAGQTPFESA